MKKEISIWIGHFHATIESKIENEIHPVLNKNAIYSYITNELNNIFKNYGFYFKESY